MDWRLLLTRSGDASMAGQIDQMQILPALSSRVPGTGGVLAVIACMFGCGGGSSIVTAPVTPPVVSKDINHQYSYAPISRSVSAVSVFATSGNVQNPSNVISGTATRLNGRNTSVTLDFGKEVAGTVTVSIAAANDTSQQIGISFSESSLYIGLASDRSSGSDLPEGALYANVSAPGTFSTPIDKLRGGFRYLTLFLTSDGWVDLNGVTLTFLASPATFDLQGYAGYFHSNDELLNRIWYAGAYTVQLNTIDSKQGRVWPPPAGGWENNAALGSGTSVLVDGAKRDRAIWPADLAIGQLTAFVSSHDLASLRNTLDALYAAQSLDGGLPYAGPAVLSFGSDTYHLWTLVATADYVLFSNDKSWLDQHWGQYKAAVAFSRQKVDANGLMNVDQYFDWGRIPLARGEELEANALFYHVLAGSSELARIEADSVAQAAFTAAAIGLKQAINARLWDAAAGVFADVPGGNLHPQDGNALALWYGVADAPAKNTLITQALRKNWNSVGAQTPEKPNTIMPFPGSMEVHARFASGDNQGALDLTRLEWGYMLNATIGTKSTFWEGYLADGTLDPGFPGANPGDPPSTLGPGISLAHAWSTGPTSALTFFALGISPIAGGEVAYSFIPHPGDLTQIEGAIVIPSGTLTASWTKDASGVLTQTVTPPTQTLGKIGVPTFGNAIRVSVDGQLVWDGCAAVHDIASRGFESSTTDGTYVYLNKMSGTHTMTSSRCQ